MSSIGEIGTDTRELERALRELLAPEQLPHYIKSARYELGTDHIGEPAVRIYLGIEPETSARMEKDKALRDEYSNFHTDLAFKIIDLQSGYFPFIRLAEAA